jgi:hypothetical protein
MEDSGCCQEIWELQPHAMLWACYSPVTVIKCQMEGWVYMLIILLVVLVFKM